MLSNFTPPHTMGGRSNVIMFSNCPTVGESVCVGVRPFAFISPE